MCTIQYVVCFPRLICRCYYIILWTCQIMSVVSLLFLNIDKFISIYYPLHYYQIMTEKLVAIQLFTGWTGTLAYTIYSYTGPFTNFANHSQTECMVIVDHIYYVVMIVSAYILPLLISLAISIYIFVIAQRISSGRRTWDGGIQTSNQTDRKNTKNRLIKRIMFVFSSTMWTSVTSLPYR